MSGVLGPFCTGSRPRGNDHFGYRRRDLWCMKPQSRTFEPMNLASAVRDMKKRLAGRRLREGR
jgi:hypothetical protein